MKLNSYAKHIFENNSIELFPDDIDTFEKLVDELHIGVSNALSEFYNGGIRTSDAPLCLINCVVNILYYFGSAEIDADAIFVESAEMCIKKGVDEFPELLANIHYMISYAKLSNGTYDDSIKYLCAVIELIVEWFSDNGMNFISELKNCIAENEKDLISELNNLN